MRTLRGILALLVLLLSLVAVPAALLAMGHYPGAGDLTWQRLVSVPDDGTVLLWLVTALGWVAWALFTVSMAAEVAALLGGPVVRLPGLAWMQAVSGTLLVAVLVMLGWSQHTIAPDQPSGMTAVAQAAPRTLPEASSVSATQGRVSDGSMPSEESGSGLGSRTEAGSRNEPGSGNEAGSRNEAGSSVPNGARQQASAHPEADTFPYTVQPGDDLWSLAEKFYGDGMAWRKMVELNPEQLGDDPDFLRAGWQLRLPVPVSSQVPGTETGPPGGPVSVAAEPSPTVPEQTPVPSSPAGIPDVVEQDAPPLGGRDIQPGADTRRGADIQPGAEEAPASAADSDSEDRRVRAEVLGGVSAVLAGGLLTGLALRRRQQLVARPLGTRPPRPTAASQQVHAALRGHQEPEVGVLVEWALHMLTRDLDRQAEVPSPAWIRVDADHVEVVWRDGGSSRATRQDVADDRAAHPGADARHPWPTLVTLGTTEEATYFLDVGSWGRLSVGTETATRAREVLTAMLMDLTTMPWSQDTEVFVVGDDGGFADTAGAPHLHHVSDLDELLDAWSARADTQAEIIRRTGLSPVLARLDPDVGDAWIPQVLVLLSDITAAQRRRLHACLHQDPAPALAVITDHPGGDLDMEVDEAPLGAVLEVPMPMGEVISLAFDPHRVPIATRDHIVALHRATDPDVAEPATWWPDDDQPTSPVPSDATAADASAESTLAEESPPMLEDPVTATTEALPGDSDPQLLVLGPVELVGARGQRPQRAPRQCLEYCAWLLEHPGRSSVEMARAMVVADSTRRSNMSRLRTWLGTSPEGDPYLPDAYSGRIHLHPGVSSDWQELLILISGGIPRASDSALTAALQLVRGVPMADAAPGSWVWAEEFRIDIVCTVRDIAHELARRHLGLSSQATGLARAVAQPVVPAEEAVCTDVDRARWALARGLVVAPGDELLLRLLMITEHRVGNTREVERIMLTLNRQARSLGVDLDEETVAVMQRVVEGRVRGRVQQAVATGGPRPLAGPTGHPVRPAAGRVPPAAAEGAPDGTSHRRAAV